MALRTCTRSMPCSGKLHSKWRGHFTGSAMRSRQAHLHNVDFDHGALLTPPWLGRPLGCCPAGACVRMQVQASMALQRLSCKLAGSVLHPTACSWWKKTLRLTGSHLSWPSQTCYLTAPSSITQVRVQLLNHQHVVLDLCPGQGCSAGSIANSGYPAGHYMHIAGAAFRGS